MLYPVLRPLTGPDLRWAYAREVQRVGVWLRYAEQPVPPRLELPERLELPAPQPAGRLQLNR